MMYDDQSICLGIDLLVTIGIRPTNVAVAIVFLPDPLSSPWLHPRCHS